MKRWSPLSIILAGALVLALGSWVLFRPASPEPSAPAGDGMLQPATYKLVNTLEDEVRREDRTATAYASLGHAYLQGARETGDGDYAAKAERAFEQALNLDEANYEALCGLGVTHLLRHQFKQALDLGQRAHALNPHKPLSYSILVDAYIELGRYDDAVETAQAMVNLRPDLTSYSRASYLRELMGETAGAIDAMARAVSAGSGSLEHTNWTRVQLGHLYFHSGDLEQAEREYQIARSFMPQYGHALAGLARIRLAQGQAEEAVSLYEQAARLMPIPEYVMALGEAYEAAGRAAEAEAQFEQAITDLKTERRSGMDVDEELALLLLERDRDTGYALDLARGAYERRPTVKNASILAWALYKTGQTADALHHAQESLRLNTHDATFFYRAGRIAQAAGETEQATRYFQQALDINPYFAEASHARTHLDTRS